ncbi:hypothetical protein NXV81_29730 [Bacteroides ovatus]|nr:hypothetical protein [Bacteroides ovatus]
MRNEGQSMDQSIFKAVLIPYIVNLALDEAANSTLRQNLILFLRKMRNIERKLDSWNLSGNVL